MSLNILSNLSFLISFVPGAKLAFGSIARIFLTSKSDGIPFTKASTELTSLTKRVIKREL